MADIDQWVIEHCFALLKTLKIDQRSFNINLSRESFENPAIISLLGKMLSKDNALAKSIIFEVAETAHPRLLFGSPISRATRNKGFKPEVVRQMVRRHPHLKSGGSLPSNPSTVFIGDIYVKLTRSHRVKFQKSPSEFSNIF